jgi:hypothetical protein
MLFIQKFFFRIDTLANKFVNNLVGTCLRRGDQAHSSGTFPNIGLHGKQAYFVQLYKPALNSSNLGLLHYHLYLK